MPAIKKLSDISNTTSLVVKKQYEENPYPRWVCTYKSKASNFMLSLQKAIYPNKIEQPVLFSDKLDVLVPGCGTGYHPISLAQIYEGASILAVDLSLASLAYAKRKAKELGLDNIDFMQADILDLHGLNKKFDVIECVGVLHHLENPVEGWRIIVDLLKPKRFMKIGLYSDYARRAQTARKEFIKKFNYDSSPDGIRECRKHIFELPEDSPIKSALASEDFYTTSSVRDLLFHTQEYCFTLPEISSILEELGLRMIGFDISEKIKQEYVIRFPDDPKAISLTYWDQFEKKHPTIFSKMYNFWIQKDS